MKSSTLATIVMTAVTSLIASLATGAPNFGEDLKFLRQHSDTVLLRDKSGNAQVVVVPAWQGRVMTSSARGEQGVSFGWVNRDLIASGRVAPHINVFGGEDRFWLGPEGGQFSVFFAKGVKFDLEHWFTPASLDTEPFKVVTQSDERVVCARSIELTNYSGTRFNLMVNREVVLQPAADALATLGAKLPAAVEAVAFETVNTVKNTGAKAWQKDTGLLSIWILGMFNASAQSTIVVPFKSGPEAKLGPIVNDSYFGKVPSDRLVVKPNALFFRADAQYRSKIGVSPRRAKPVLGSYDSANQTLTLVKFSLPAGTTDYVNSMWQLQDDPFNGDAVNSYNDDGKLGKFYELESSSPALTLKPGESATHRQQTLHLRGTERELEGIAQAVLGVGLAEIKTAFAK